LAGQHKPAGGPRRHARAAVFLVSAAKLDFVIAAAKNEKAPEFPRGLVVIALIEISS
jgi:hypothetical protein